MAEPAMNDGIPAAYGPTPGKWWPSARFAVPDGDQWQAMQWVIAAPTESAALEMAREHFSGRALDVRVVPAPLYIGAQNRNQFRIHITRDHEGIACTDGGAMVLRIDINDYGKSGVNPERLRMAESILAALNAGTL